MASKVELARTVVKRHSLKPSVDILALAAGYADVQHIEFPADLNHDGVCLNAKRRGHVRILINTVGRSSRRMRFTLAHQLGHVLIPWHTGTIVDESNPAAGIQAGTYWEMEGEANRFASELLMPAEWVAGFMSTLDTPVQMVRAISRGADVSYQAAVFRLVPMLPRGYVYAGIDDQGVVVFGARSPRTIATAPYKGQRIAKPSQHFAWASERWSDTRTGITHIWWHSGGASRFPDFSAIRSLSSFASLKARSLTILSASALLAASTDCRAPSACLNSASALPLAASTSVAFVMSDLHPAADRYLAE